MKGLTDFTEGDVRKNILLFFFPMLATNMLQQVYTFVDTAIVGNGLGDHALAAVGNTGVLSFLIIGFSFGLANGFSILFSREYGAKDFEKLRHYIAAAILLCAGLTVVVTAFSLIFLKDVLILMRTDEIIMKDSLVYGSIIFGGFAFNLMYNMSSYTLRSLGDSKTPLKAIVISSVLNLVLDCLFIFVFHSGVEGAAIATIISQLISTLVCLHELTKISFIKLSASDFANSAGVYMELIRNGVPMAAMNSITAVGCMVIQYFVNGFGVDYTSAYAACSKYTNLFITPACSAGHTMASFTSQNYGAKRYERIRQGLRMCLAIAMVTYLIFGSSMIFYKRFLADILLEGEAPIRLAMQYFPICGIMMFAVDALFIYRSGVQGLGAPAIPMYSGVVEMAVRVVVILAFVSSLGFPATAYAEVGAWVGALIMNAAAFYHKMGKLGAYPFSKSKREAAFS